MLWLSSALDITWKVAVKYALPKRLLYWGTKRLVGIFSSDNKVPQDIRKVTVDELLQYVGKKYLKK